MFVYVFMSNQRNFLVVVTYVFFMFEYRFKSSIEIKAVTKYRKDELVATANFQT